MSGQALLNIVLSLLAAAAFGFLILNERRINRLEDITDRRNLLQHDVNQDVQNDLDDLASRYARLNHQMLSLAGEKADNEAASRLPWLESRGNTPDVENHADAKRTMVFLEDYEE